MILVKRSNLYILTALVCALLVLGELRFFMALRSVNLATNLTVKYEVESFIFASIVLTLVVFLFLVYFMRRSDNVLKRLDKMIELSEFGEHDIGPHLAQLDTLGKKIEYLLFKLRELNDMKSLKISSLSGISEFLIDNNRDALFLLNRHGNIVGCSNALLQNTGIQKSAIIKRGVNELYKDIHYEELFFDLEKKGSFIVKKDLTAAPGGAGIKHEVAFYPVMNSQKQISHIIGLIRESGGESR